jgi:hypothetical protein
MWDQQAVIDAGDEEFLNGKTWTINNFVSRWVYMTSDGGSSVEWNVKDIQSLLKPQYRIVDSVNESDDEWSVDAPEEWGLEPLTVGDTITPNMWKDIDKLKYRFQELGVESPTDVLIKKIQCWDTGLENDCVVRLVLKNPPLSLNGRPHDNHIDVRINANDNVTLFTPTTGSMVDWVLQLQFIQK